MHDEQEWQDYRSRLLSYARKRVGSLPDAEDLVHDVLARAYAHRDSLHSHGSLRAWLYQIMRNAIADYYRGRRPHESLPDGIAAHEEEDEPARQELARCLHPLIDRLPAPYREAIKYAEIDGLTQRETAKRLALSHSGAKSRVQRARAMLGAELLACCSVALDSRGSISEFARNTPGGEVCAGAAQREAQVETECCTQTKREILQ